MSSWLKDLTRQSLQEAATLLAFEEGAPSIDGAFFAQVHAPHTMTIDGTEYRGGQFIPADALGKLTPEAKKELISHEHLRAADEGEILAHDEGGGKLTMRGDEDFRKKVNSYFQKHTDKIGETFLDALDDDPEQARDDAEEDLGNVAEHYQNAVTTHLKSRYGDMLDKADPKAFADAVEAAMNEAVEAVYAAAEDEDTSEIGWEIKSAFAGIQDAASDLEERCRVLEEAKESETESQVEEVEQHFHDIENDVESTLEEIENPTDEDRAKAWKEVIAEYNEHTFTGPYKVIMNRDGELEAIPAEDAKFAFNAVDHPRGQPKNAGQFGKKTTKRAPTPGKPAKTLEKEASGDTPVSPGTVAQDIHDGEQQRASILKRYGAKISHAVDTIPVVSYVKSKVTAMMGKIHAVAEKRYGPKSAAAIMASGTVVDLALMGGGMALTGIPIATGVNQLLGILPAFAIAELGHRLTGGKKFSVEDESTAAPPAVEKELMPEEFEEACKDVGNQIVKEFRGIIQSIPQPDARLSLDFSDPEAWAESSEVWQRPMGPAYLWEPYLDAAMSIEDAEGHLHKGKGQGGGQFMAKDNEEQNTSVSDVKNKLTSAEVGSRLTFGDKDVDRREDEYTVWLPSDYGGKKELAFPDANTTAQFLDGEIVGLNFSAPETTGKTVPISEDAPSYKGQDEPWTERKTGEEVTTKPMLGWHYGGNIKKFSAKETCFYRQFKKNKIAGHGYMVVIPVGTNVSYYGDEVRFDLQPGMKIYRLKSGWCPHDVRKAEGQSDFIGHTQERIDEESTVKILEGIKPSSKGGKFSIDEDGKGKWITIGAKGDPKKGGSPVYVDNGRITKGNSRLTGKKISALEEGPEEKPELKEGATKAEEKAHKKEVRGLHQGELNQSRAYQRSLYAKEARKLGIDKHSLHQLAAEVLEHNRAFTEDTSRMLKDARATMNKYGESVGGKKFQDAIAKGTFDYSNLPHFDELATSMASQHPDVFLGYEDDPDARLADLLTAGEPEAMDESQAYEQAIEHLASMRLAKREAEEVPFSIEDQQGHLHSEKDGRFTSKEDRANDARAKLPKWEQERWDTIEKRLSEGDFANSDVAWDYPELAEKYGVPNPDVEEMKEAKMTKYPKAKPFAWPKGGSEPGFVYRIQPIGSDLHGQQSQTSNEDELPGVFVFDNLNELGAIDWHNEENVELLKIKIKPGDLFKTSDQEGVGLKSGRGKVVGRNEGESTNAIRDWAIQSQ